MHEDDLKKTLEEILFYIFLNLQSSVTFFLFTDKTKRFYLIFNTFRYNFEEKSSN